MGAELRKTHEVQREAKAARAEAEAARAEAS